MNVYITYDRYEHNEWFSIYHLDTNLDRAIEHCREIDLFDFISYGPDDCHSFQLQELEMSEYMYRKLRKFVNSTTLTDEEKEKFDELMERIYDGEFGDITHIFTDGCTDNVELIEFYCIKKGIEADDDDAIEAAQDELYDDGDLYETILREYIKATY